MPIYESFLLAWKPLSELTIEFIQGTPIAYWEHSPHPKYGPLCKQFRHMVWVRGLYNDCLKTGKLTFSKKKTFYSGSMKKEDLIEGLREKDRELQEILAHFSNGTAIEKFSAFGTALTFSEMTAIMIEHEANHHGLWSIYAATAGFKTPESWDESWGL